MRMRLLLSVLVLVATAAALLWMRSHSRGSQEIQVEPSRQASARLAKPVAPAAVPRSLEAPSVAPESPPPRNREDGRIEVRVKSA